MATSCSTRVVAWAVLLAGVCSGCVLHAPALPSPDLPPAFESATPGVSASAPKSDWYRAFASDELDGLETAALAGNFDVATARARVTQAEARTRQAHGATLPVVDVGGNVNYLAGHSNEGSAHETDWAGLVTTSYELDFWGKNSAAADAAQHQEFASRADRDTVALTTVAGVATRYFELLTLRERLGIARDNVQTARSLMDIVDSRYHVGLSNPVEVATQRATLATAELVIPDLEQKEQEALAAIAILVGRVPEGFRIHGTALASLTEPEVAAGLPSDLLRRRPDIATAESNLQAAGADLVVARAALYPSLNLTASGGVQNPAVNAAVITLGGVGPTLAMGASLAQPLFDGGRLRGKRAEVEGKLTEATVAYRAAIAAALVDVENALAAITHLNAARQFQTESLAQSEQAYEGARLRYQAGYGDFLTVLEAQRSLYAARDQMSQYRLQRLQALVNLNKALGGGWESSHLAASTTASPGPAAPPRPGPSSAP